MKRFRRFFGLLCFLMVVALSLTVQAAWSYRWLIQPDAAYRYLTPVAADIAVFTASEGEDLPNKKGLIRLSDAKILVPAAYDEIYALADGYFALGKNIPPKRVPGPGEWGVCDADGNIVVPFAYAYGFTAIGNRYLVAQKMTSGKTAADWGVIDYAGNTVLPFVYEHIVPKFYPAGALYQTKDDSPLFAKKDGKYGLIELSGKLRIPFIYGTLTQDFTNPARELIYAETESENGYLFGFIDYDGNVVVPFAYSHGYFVSEDALIVYLSDASGAHYGMINTSGDILLPLVYDNLSDFADSSLVQAVLQGKTGLFDLAGQPVVPVEYGAVNVLDDARVMAEKDGKWGMLDRKGTGLLPFDYDYLEKLSDTALQAKKGDYFAIIRPDGTEITPYEFTNLQKSYQKGYIIACKGASLYGVLDEDGNEIVACEYDGIYETDTVKASNGLWWIAQKGQRMLLIDKDGKECFSHSPCNTLAYNAEWGLCTVVTESGAGILHIVGFSAENRQTVTVSDGVNRVSLVLGQTEARLNGEVKTLDTPPFLRHDRTYVPVRFLAESLGAQVFWDEKTQSASFVKNGLTVRLTIGTNTAYVNDRPQTLDATVFLENDRTYAPIRFVAEALGAEVAWSEEK